VLRPAHDNPLHENKRQSCGEVLFQNNNVEKSTNAIVPEENDTPTEIDQQSLLNYEFIHHIGPHGYRAKVTEHYEDQDKHLISIGNGNKEEIVTYNHMLDVVNKRLEEVEDKDAHETLWFLENIVGHRLNHDKRKHSVKVRWSTKEETWEPLDIIAVDDPVACAKHAKENDLLELPGWKRFKRLAAHEKKFIRMLHQAYASKKKNATKHVFGVRIPRNYQEALAFDKANGNTFWEDATKKEMDQINAYNTFKDVGKGVRVPSGYQKVYVHLMCVNKFDMRRKARLALSGQLTPPSNDKACSGIVSLEGARTVLFLAELNEL